jgi:hypothetical protein
MCLNFVTDLISEGIGIIWKEAVLAQSGNYPSIGLECLGKKHGTISHDIQSPGRDSNRIQDLVSHRLANLFGESHKINT